ncbi:MAG TPA: 16S rRNA (cytosine(1402)-N(4))-methyltransferase RsmH [Phycisphaerae bacterium]|nr:16S rRNA (cytosine(1402)-N(4))-methyltransferase RsmH [Phycisphaerae bacterium]
MDNDTDFGQGHVAVLARQVSEYLSPVGRRVLVDCTVGLGGHSEVLLSQADEDACLIGLDVDEACLRAARERLEPFGRDRVRLFLANFSQLPEVLQEADVGLADVILADLGVCSAQLDDPARGLSFQADGPLDMRLDARSDLTAAKIVGTFGEEELADLIYEFGQERYSRRIARAIVNARKAGAIISTAQLEKVIFGSLPGPVRRSRRGVHPATRTFQALRIAVNDEMKNLDVLLESLKTCLAPGGVAGIISFHSLEDRRVKMAFRQWALAGTAEVLTPKPITADAAESGENPRSRSAKLRVVKRLN